MPSERAPSGEPTPHQPGEPPRGYATMAHAITADRELSDRAYRVLAALKSWAWDKDVCWPSNRQIAQRCGWISEWGRPNLTKVKETLRELEATGYGGRDVELGSGGVQRVGIRLLPKARAEDPGLDPARGRAELSPPPGGIPPPN